MRTVKQKLYCYVDESGQDTKGDVLAGFVRDVLEKQGADMEKLFKEAIKDENLIEVLKNHPQRSGRT